jgi:vacuolar-type H+-ATPase subunit H
MSYDDRPVSGGPARDDPELGDTLAPRVGGGGEDEGAGAAERARDVASTGREQAREVASSAGDRARDVASTASGEAQEVVRATGDQARRLASDARQELRNQAEAQAQRLADGLDDLTRQLRSMGERGEPGPATDLVRQAGEQTHRLAERLRQGGVDDALGELRDFGRNRPGLFLLGAFGLGLAGGRIARNLAQEPGGNGGTQARTTGPGPAQRAPTGPPPAIVPDTGADVGAYEAPLPAGHTAYGAPYGDPYGRR